MNKNVKKQDSIKRNFKPVGGIKNIEQGKTLTDGEKVDCRRCIEVRKGVNPSMITSKGVTYLNILVVIKLLTPYKLGNKGNIIFMAVASYGSDGCRCYNIMNDLYGYVGSQLRRAVNRCLELLVRVGLVVRVGMRVFVSDAGLRLLGGRG